MSRSRSPFDSNPLSGIAGFIIALVVLYLIFNLFSIAWKILAFAAPVMFIASLIIDSSVASGYLKSIKSLFDRKWYYGLAALVLSLVAYPLTASYMLGMSLFRKKLKNRAQEMDEQINGKWTEYEDVTEETMDLDIPYEELPPAPEP
ncbi:MAG: hypothetical protein AAF597_04580, partial [Bacteroidota bacterium]